VHGYPQALINVRPARYKEPTMKYRVLIEQDEDGMFVVQVPALAGCISQGKTRTEALKNIQEAIEAYIESLQAHDEPIPPSIDEEVAFVSVLPRVSGQEVVAALTKVGYEKDRQKGSHIVLRQVAYPHRLMK
jgi:predicted RNase H-like HicB family nuclease